MSSLGPGVLIADKYRLERPLAAGGMGAIWSAWNTQLDVPVAVKVITPVLAVSRKLLARFEREARAAAQIRGPHVVQIFEHGVHRGSPFIVMELLGGEDLGARMRRCGRLPLPETAWIVRDVARALQRAHAMGIVHRDLKPANIFLARAGDEEGGEIVKVLDFGIVKSMSEIVESGVTKTGEVVGTPHYMSPEQARGTKSVDHRSDLWSLGIIAYRALTGTVPFADDEGFELALRISSQPAPPPTSLAPDLPAEIDLFFARALAIDPSARFQTARELAGALRALAGVTGMEDRQSTTLTSSVVPPPGDACEPQAYVYASAAETRALDAVRQRGSRSSYPPVLFPVSTQRAPGWRRPLAPAAPSPHEDSCPGRAPLLPSPPSPQLRDADRITCVSVRRSPRARRPSQSRPCAVEILAAPTLPTEITAPSCTPPAEPGCTPPAASPVERKATETGSRAGSFPPVASARISRPAAESPQLRQLTIMQASYVATIALLAGAILALTLHGRPGEADSGTGPAGAKSPVTAVGAAGARRIQPEPEEAKRAPALQGLPVAPRLPASGAARVSPGCPVGAPSAGALRAMPARRKEGSAGQPSTD